MRQSRIEKRLAQARPAAERVKTDLDGLMAIMAGGPLNPTQRRFVYSPERLALYMGPEGCAKSTSLGLIAFARAMFQPGSQVVVARYDYNDVLDTTAVTMQRMLERLPEGALLDRVKQPPMKWYIQSAVPDGLPGTITFRGLKDGIPSGEFNTVCVDQVEECSEENVHLLDGRLRAAGGDYKLALASNGVPKLHWIHQAVTGRNANEEVVCEPWLTVFNPEPEENVKNLPPNYYERRRKHYTKDMALRLIEGTWGANYAGKPVYGKEFVRTRHVRQQLEHSALCQMLRFWDFGYRHPAVLWAQVNTAGQLRVFRELLDADVEIGALAMKVRAFSATWFPDVPDHAYVDYGDPAVVQKKSTGQDLHELVKAGVVMHFKHHQVDEGLQTVRRELERNIGGEPAVVVDASCVNLIEALTGGYRYPEVKFQSPMTTTKLAPLKDGYFEHVADAFRYGVDGLFGAGFAGTQGDVPDTIAYDPRNSEMSPAVDYETPTTLEQFLRET